MKTHKLKNENTNTTIKIIAKTKNDLNKTSFKKFFICLQIYNIKVFFHLLKKFLFFNIFYLKYIKKINFCLHF